VINAIQFESVRFTNNEAKLSGGSNKENFLKGYRQDTHQTTPHHTTNTSSLLCLFPLFFKDLD
jgi:hypothetical protein